MGALDLISQAQSSLTFTVTAAAIIVFFAGWLWIPLILIIGIALGCAERRLINKRMERPPSNTAVVITGCSSGFGFRLATRLANAKVYVFAGVRKEEDAEALRKATFSPEYLHPVLLDVTNEEQILAATALVDGILSKKGLSLLALVNNAGYGDYGPVETMSTKRWRNMFEVNVFGVVTMTQAFLPLLRKYYAKGPLRSRVINISSGAGRVVMPPSGPYCASKFALEALTDALRMELKPWDIKMVLVEPGRFHTEFQEKAYQEMVVDGFSALDDTTKAHYASLVQRVNLSSASHKRPPLENCVRVIEDALLDTKPLARYLAGTDVQFGIPLLGLVGHETVKDLVIGRWWRTLQK